MKTEMYERFGRADQITEEGLDELHRKVDNGFIRFGETSSKERIGGRIFFPNATVLTIVILHYWLESPFVSCGLFDLT